MNYKPETFLLKKSEEQIYLNYSNQKKIEQIKKQLEFNKNQLKGFNTYSFILGMAFTHTFLIYSKKQVLHQMENKALQHMGICLFCGLSFGFLVGQVFGKNFSNFSYCNNLIALANKRLNEFK